jgi:ribosomal protein S18 acetylase RimI-like enzyme
MFAAPAFPLAFAQWGCFLRAAAAYDGAFERILFETARPDTAVLATWPEAARKRFLDQQFQFQTIHYERAYPKAFRGIVEAFGEPVGRIILDCATEPWCIVDIALMPRWRGRGLGGALLRAVQDAAARSGVAVVLTVDMNNKAQRLYRRLGFVVTEQALPNVAMAWRPA